MKSTYTPPNRWSLLDQEAFDELKAGISESMESRRPGQLKATEGDKLFQLMEHFFHGMCSSFYHARHIGSSAGLRIDDMSYKLAQVLAGDLRGHLLD